MARKFVTTGDPDTDADIDETLDVAGLGGRAIQDALRQTLAKQIRRSMRMLSVRELAKLNAFASQLVSAQLDEEG